MTSNMAGKLFAIDDPSEWRLILSSYEKVLEIKACKSKKTDLVALDDWYQNILPNDIKARKPPYISKEDLIKVMKWKLTRGKFRPRLTQLVDANTEDEVREVSRKALSQISNSKMAIKELTALKGVGPATASAILSAASPGKFPFMADEAVLAVHKGDIQYNIGTYLLFQETLKDIAKGLNTRDDRKDWNPHKVELCLWTREVAQKLKVDISGVIKEDSSLKRPSEPSDEEGGASKKAKNNGSVS